MGLSAACTSQEAELQPRCYTSSLCAVNRDRVAKDVFDDMWGYLVHLKSTGQLLLMLHNTNGLHSIQQHPVFQYMQQQSHR